MPQAQTSALQNLTGALYLASLLFGLAFLVIAPIQIYDVYQAKTYGETITGVVNQSYARERGRKCEFAIGFNLIADLENPNQPTTIVIRDAVPGDYANCSSKARYAAQYKKGQSYNIVKLGDRYYLNTGQYWWSLSLALLGYLPYCYLLYSIRQEKHQTPENGQN